MKYMKRKWKPFTALMLCFSLLLGIFPSFHVKIASAAVQEIDLHQSKLGYSIKSSWTMHDNGSGNNRVKKVGSHMWRFRVGGRNAYCLDFGKHSFESGDPDYGDKGMFLQDWDYSSSFGSTWTGNAPSGVSNCTSKTRAMMAAAMFVEKNPNGCTLATDQRRMFAQTAIWAIRCQTDWKSGETISDHKPSVISQFNNLMDKVSGVSTKYKAEEVYDYIFKTDWSSSKIKIRFFKSCKYDSKGNVVEPSGYQHFMNIRIMPEEDYEWDTVGASEGYHQRVRVHKTDETGRALAGVKFRLTLTSDTENVYDYHVSLADGSMADTEDVAGSEGIDADGNDYIIATTNSSGYAYFFIARNNSVDASFGYITSPTSPSEKIIGLAMQEMENCGVSFHPSKAEARKAAEKALSNARDEILDEGIISEEVSSLPDECTTIAKQMTVYNRKVGGNGSTNLTVNEMNVDMSSPANSGARVIWTSENVFRKSNGEWLDSTATSTGIGSKTHGNRNDVSEVNVVDKIKKIKVNVLKKADTKDGKAYGDATLAGAQYQLYSDSACTKKATVYDDGGTEKTAGVYTTTEDGVLTTDYLLCGVTYYIKEVKAPTGFLLSNEVKPIKISGAEMDANIEFGNSPSKEYIEAMEYLKTNNIYIYKILDENEQNSGQVAFEQGVTFQVFYIENLEKQDDGKGGFIYSYKGSYEDADPDYERDQVTTDQWGRATTKKLAYGTYMVHQLDTGQYDTEKVADFPITIEEDVTEKSEGYPTVMSNKLFKAYLRINKIDANTKQTVLKSGTAYEIYKVDPKTGEETKVVQTGSNGKKIITLDRFTTDEEGMVETLKPLPSATYRIREVESAPGLHQVKEYIEVEINSNNTNYTVEPDPESGYSIITVTVDYENEETPGRLSIAKKGEQLKGYDSEKKEFTYEEAYLKGVTFEVYAREDIVTQDNQGTNWYDKGELVATIHSGEDVQFSKECEGITGYEMDENGIITLDLPLGEYTVKEVKTLYGYVLPDKDWDVSFTWEDKEASYVTDSSGTAGEDGKLEILNVLARASVSILKKDNTTEKPVSDAVFGLYAADNIYNADGELIVEKDTLLDSVTTDEEGRAVSAMTLPLMSEDYEKKTDSGNEDKAEEPDAGEQKPDQNGDQDQEADQDKEENLDQNKEQETDQMPGDDNEDLKDLQEDGQSRLNSGNYYFKELSIASSYYLDQTPVAIHVEYKDQKTSLIEAQMVKGNDQTQVEIDKLTLAGSKELPGCKLLVSDAVGNVIVEWISGDAESIQITSIADVLGYRNLAASMTEKGNLVIAGLLQDTEYILTERKPADGYTCAENIIFKLGAGENNQIYISNGASFVKGNTGNRVMMYDDTTKIRFRKIASDTKKQLTGADIEVYDSKGEKIYSFTTGKKAEKIVGVLAVGKTYTFKEVKAPKGYKTARAVKLKVANSGEFQVVRMKDKAYGKISTGTPDDIPGDHFSPKTGYTFLSIFLSMLMLSSGTAVFLLKRKRRRTV